MKLKKGLIVAVISILILSISTSSFAESLRDKMKKNTKKSANTISNSVTNDVSNKTSNKVSNEVSNKIENKVSNKVSNEVSNKTSNEVSNEIEDEIEKEKEDNSDDADIASIRMKVKNKDITVVEPTDELEYENLRVNGNVFIVSANKVKLENMIINGDVMIFSAKKSELISCEVNGSVYVASDVINVEDSMLLSMYLFGSEINIDNNTEIIRELKTIGTNITFDGEVGRGFYGIGGNIVIEDNAKIYGDANIKSEEKDISRKADIENLDYEEIAYTRDNQEMENDERIITYFINEGVGIAIILVIAIFLLCFFPKFVGVNSKLRLRNFFTDFLLGILMFIISLAISVGLFFTGYGAGYGIILLNLTFLFVLLGKAIFTISFGIRLSRGPEKTSKVKAFFATVLVALVLSLVGMISLAGNVGIIINMVLDVLLAFTGFGAMFKVIFASKKKYENNRIVNQEMSYKSNPPKEQPKVEEQRNIFEVVEKEDKPVQEESKENIEEVKEELKEEVKEPQEEQKAESETETKTKTEGNTENDIENKNDEEDEEDEEDKKE